MKKISSILLALTMLLALCIPAFAGDAVTAMTQEGGKQIAAAIVDYVDNYVVEDVSAQEILANAETRQRMYKEAVLPAITSEKFRDEAYRKTSVDEAVKALTADYDLDAELAETMVKELNEFLVRENVGIDKFDKDEIKDAIADNFSPNDLNALFDSLRNTVTDLSGRVTGVLRGMGGNKGDENVPPTEEEKEDTEAQPDPGMQEPTGDTAIFAVFGVAAVAGATLLVTRKKSSK